MSVVQAVVDFVVRGAAAAAGTADGLVAKLQGAERAAQSAERASKSAETAAAAAQRAAAELQASTARIIGTAHRLVSLARTGLGAAEEVGLVDAQAVAGATAGAIVDFGGGVASGAAQGFAVGGPKGAVVGAIVGGVRAAGELRREAAAPTETTRILGPDPRLRGLGDRGGVRAERSTTVNALVATPEDLGDRVALDAALVAAALRRASEGP